MTDAEFAAYIDQVHAALNSTTLSPSAQYWSPEMIIERIVQPWKYGLE